MASLKLITNLKLIEGTSRTTVPTTAELPLGYMCFGIVNGRASIWGNYNNEVVDLVQSGQVSIDIVQVTGQSTTAVISQKGVTDALTSLENSIDGELNTVKQSVQDIEADISNLGTAAQADTGTAAGNVPVLDSSGKLPQSTIPATAITDVFVVDSQTEMLALNAQPGDVAIRTDVNMSFILQTAPASTLENWKQLLTPDCKVLSVNGKQGAVVLSGADILSNFTQASSRTNVATGEALNVSLGKIAKWFADLKALAFKDQIDATTDISGVIPQKNLPDASSDTAGIIRLGAGLRIVHPSTREVAVDLCSTGAIVYQNYSDSGLKVNVGNGVKINSSNQLEADVVLEIGTI